MIQRLTLLIFASLFLSMAQAGAQCEWVQTGSTKQAGQASSGAVVSTDGAGNSYLAINYTNTFTIQGQTINNLYAGKDGVALVKLNLWGGVEWITNCSSPAFKASDVEFRGNNVYLAGNYTSYVTINGQNVSGQGENGVIYKFSAADGGMIWGRGINSPSSSYCYDIAFIDDNNFLFTGRFRQSIIVDGNMITGMSASRNYGLYGKMNTSGTLAWMKTSGESGNLCTPSRVVVEPGGAFYLGGVYRQGLAFGGITAPNPGSTIASVPFVAKFNQSGDVQWLQAATVPVGSGTLGSEIRDMARHTSGDIVLAGLLDKSVAFLGMTSDGESTAAMFRVNTSGSLVNSLEVRSDNAGNAFSISQFDGSGNLWLGGTASGSLSVYANGSLHSQGTVTKGSDLLLAYYSASTGFAGIKRFGGMGDEIWFGGDIDASNRFIATGSFQGPFMFNGQNLNSNNASTPDFQVMKVCTSIPGTGTSDLLEPDLELTLQPNPAVGQTTLATTAEWAGATGRLLDVHGQLIREFRIVREVQNLALDGLAPGWYFVQLAGIRGVTGRPLIIGR